MAKNRHLANLIATSATPVADVAANITITGVSNQANTSTGYIDLPAGTTAQRPASPHVGMIRYNTTLGFLEQYTADGWQGIAPPPAITTISPTTYNGEQGTTFTINGSSFDTTAAVKFITAQGTEYTAATVTRVSNSQLTATTPQDFTVANEPLKVKVINGSGLAYTLDNAIDCGGVPSWVTAAGSVATVYDATSGTHATISASDPDAGASVTYSITSGAVPSGTTLNASTGVISGTLGTVSSSTTYNFTVTATDNAGNTSFRAFSMTVNPRIESGAGAGYVTALSDSTNANVLTTMSNTNYLSNATNQGGCDGNWLDFNRTSGTFTMHTGHQPSWWPTVGAVQITSGTPKVVNRFRWYRHGNSCGNVDFYGSNQAITGSNFTDTSLYTYLGRGNVGGYAGASESSVVSLSFNPNGYGYRWYMIRIMDNQGSAVDYPSYGSRGGWADYGATWDKV